MRTEGLYGGQDGAIDPTTFRTGSGRAFVVPGTFAVLAMAVAATGPDGPTVAVCGAIAVLSVAWMVRAARAGIELRDAGVVVRGTLLTRTIPWARIERALVMPVRGRTTLTLQLEGGRQRCIEELAATGHGAAIVVAAATEISRRVAERAG